MKEQNNHPLDYKKRYEDAQLLIEIIHSSNPEYAKETLNLSLRYRIFACISKAVALGLDPMSVAEGAVYYIKGKMALQASLMNTLIRREGHAIETLKTTKEECVIRSTRKDTGKVDTVKFSIQDAAEAGLLESITWKKYREMMLFNRCMSKLARQVFPDVFKGSVYTKEELDEIPEIQITPAKSARELEYTIQRLFIDEEEETPLKAPWDFESDDPKKGLVSDAMKELPDFESYKDVLFTKHAAFSFRGEREYIAG